MCVCEDHSPTPTWRSPARATTVRGPVHPPARTGRQRGVDHTGASGPCRLGTAHLQRIVPRLQRNDDPATHRVPGSDVRVELGRRGQRRSAERNQHLPLRDDAGRRQVRLEQGPAVPESPPVQPERRAGLGDHVPVRPADPVQRMDLRPGRCRCRSGHHHRHRGRWGRGAAERPRLPVGLQLLHARGLQCQQRRAELERHDRSPHRKRRCRRHQRGLRLVRADGPADLALVHLRSAGRLPDLSDLLLRPGPQSDRDGRRHRRARPPQGHHRRAVRPLRQPGRHHRDRCGRAVLLRQVRHV